MTSKQRIRHIVKWIKQYATKNKISTLVVGISGGTDSSVSAHFAQKQHSRPLWFRCPFVKTESWTTAVVCKPAGCWNATKTSHT